MPIGESPTTCGPGGITVVGAPGIGARLAVGPAAGGPVSMGALGSASGVLEPSGIGNGASGVLGAGAGAGAVAVVIRVGIRNADEAGWSVGLVVTVGVAAVGCEVVRTVGEVGSGMVGLGPSVSPLCDGGRVNVFVLAVAVAVYVGAGSGGGVPASIVGAGASTEVITGLIAVDVVGAGAEAGAMVITGRVATG